MTNDDVIKEAKAFMLRYYKLLNTGEIQKAEALYQESCKRKILCSETPHKSVLLFGDEKLYDSSCKVVPQSFCADKVKDGLLVVSKGDSPGYNFCQTLYLMKEGANWMISNEILCLIEQVPESATSSQDVENSCLQSQRRTFVNPDSKTAALSNEEISAKHKSESHGKKGCENIHCSTNSVRNSDVKDALTIARDINSKSGDLISTLMNLDARKYGEGDACEYGPLIPSHVPVPMAPAPAQRNVCILSNPLMSKHTSKKAAEEKGSRLKAIMARLKKDGILERCAEITSEVAKEEDILLVHTKEYLDVIRLLPMNQAQIKNMGYEKYLGWVFFSKGTFKAALLSAGCVIEGLEAVMSGKYDAAFAICRPPGHHAKPEKACGFCFFNNVAIAVEHLLKIMGFKKAAVLDVDVHHGDGTQSIFYGRKDVFVFSIHSSKIDYPADENEPISRSKECIGEGQGLGFNVNVNLDKGYGDSDMLMALRELFVPLAEEFAPDVIFISMGFDAVEKDTLGDAKLSEACFGSIIQVVRRINTGRLVVALEGGYNLDLLPGCASVTASSLLGDQHAILNEESLAAPLPTTAGIVSDLKERLHPYWDVFRGEEV